MLVADERSSESLRRKGDLRKKENPHRPKPTRVGGSRANAPRVPPVGGRRTI